MWLGSAAGGPVSEEQREKRWRPSDLNRCFEDPGGRGVLQRLLLFSKDQQGVSIPVWESRKSTDFPSQL